MHRQQDLPLGNLPIMFVRVPRSWNYESRYVIKMATGMVDKEEGMVEYQMGAGLLAILKMKISTCNFKIEMMEIPSSLFTERPDRRLTIVCAERQIGNVLKPYLPIGCYRTDFRTRVSAPDVTLLPYGILISICTSTANSNTAFATILQLSPQRGLIPMCTDQTEDCIRDPAPVALT